MKRSKILSIITTAFFFLLSMSSHAEPVSGKEYQAVVETAFNYFNGAANGDQKLLAKAFDLDFGHVKMIRVDKETGKETIRTVTLKEFSGYFKKATKDTWEANILSVDIVDEKDTTVSMRRLAKMMTKRKEQMMIKNVPDASFEQQSKKR